MGGSRTAAVQLFSSYKDYPKVLKVGQLELFRFQTVSRTTGRGSLGKEMGKLLGKSLQPADDLPSCFRAPLAHLIYMTAVLPCDEEPCRDSREKGVCLP